MALPKELAQSLPSHKIDRPDNIYLVPTPSEVVVPPENQEITSEQLAGYWGKAVDDLAEGKPRRLAGAALVTIVEFAKKPSRIARAAGFLGIKPVEIVVTAVDLMNEMEKK